MNGDIAKYDIINPTSDNTNNYYDSNKNSLFLKFDTKYKYYIECASNNEFGGRDYYLILGKTKFNKNSRICRTNMYRKTIIKPKGELKSFLIENHTYNKKVNVEYVESDKDFDIYSVS